MHGLAEQQGAARTPAVARTVALMQQALAELEAQLAAGLSGVKAASDVRMSMCEEPSLSPPHNSQNFQAVQGHRSRVVQFLDRWNSECEKSPAGASNESKARPPERVCRPTSACAFTCLCGCNHSKLDARCPRNFLAVAPCSCRRGYDYVKVTSSAGERREPFDGADGARQRGALHACRV